MDAAAVLTKLLEVERAITRGDYQAVLLLVMEAEECVLQVERETLKTLGEHEGHRPG
jgi:hypothetical protein